MVPLGTGVGYTPRNNQSVFHAKSHEGKPEWKAYDFLENASANCWKRLQPPPSGKEVKERYLIQ